MITSTLMLLAAISAQPTKTTPAEIITTCYYNDALVDAALLHHVVDVTSKVTSVTRDGIGGYIARLDARVQTAEFDARASILCYFDGAAMSALTRIRPGREITIRGVVSNIADDTNHYLDPNVQVTMKRCELLAGAE